MDGASYLFEKLQMMHENENNTNKRKYVKESITTKNEKKTNDLEDKWVKLKKFKDDNKQEECDKAKLKESISDDLQDVDFIALQDYDENEHDGEIFDFYRFADLDDFCNDLNGEFDTSNYVDEFATDNVDNNIESDEDLLDEAIKKEKKLLEDDDEEKNEESDDEVEIEDSKEDEEKSDDETIDLVAFATNNKITLDTLLNEIVKYVDVETLNNVMTNVLSDIESGEIAIIEDEEDDEELEEATSGIGAGSYTSKAIDLFENNENKVQYFIDKINEEDTKVGLVHILHEIRACRQLNKEEKADLETTLKDKFATLNVEIVTESVSEEEGMTLDDFKNWFDKNQSDPVVAEYNGNFKEWFRDSIKNGYIKSNDDDPSIYDWA